LWKMFLPLAVCVWLIVLDGANTSSYKLEPKSTANIPKSLEFRPLKLKYIFSLIVLILFLHLLINTNIVYHSYKYLSNNNYYVIARMEANPSTHYLIFHVF